MCEYCANCYDGCPQCGKGKSILTNTTTMKIGITNTIHIHESDGLSYLSYPPQSKCKVCGEFYY